MSVRILVLKWGIRIEDKPVRNQTPPHRIHRNAGVEWQIWDSHKRGRMWNLKELLFHIHCTRQTVPLLFLLSGG